MARRKKSRVTQLLLDDSLPLHRQRILDDGTILESSRDSVWEEDNETDASWRWGTDFSKFDDDPLDKDDLTREELDALLAAEASWPSTTAPASSWKSASSSVKSYKRWGFPKNKDISEIYPSLYQAGIQEPENITALGIKAVFAVASRSEHNIVARAPNVLYTEWSVFEGEPIPKEEDRLWYQAEKAARFVRQGIKVCVQCQQGHNRSGLLIALIVHILTGMSGNEIIDLMREKRDPRNINNAGIIRYVERLQKKEIDRAEG